MSSRGYLCFLCLPSEAGDIEILADNMVMIYPGFSLVPVLKNFAAIVLSTGNIQPDWAGLLHHKLLWLHVDMEDAVNPQEDIYNQADLISYYSTTLVTEKFSLASKGLCLKSSTEHQLNADLIEERIKSLPEGWLPYANLDLTGKVAVMAATFLDFSGEYFYNGGAERYLLDLADICAELNRELVVFQYGDYPWMRHFKNIEVVSLSRQAIRAEGWILKCARDFNLVFYEQVQGRAALNIYSPFYEAWPLAAMPNTGISHGVSWDNPYNDYENAVEYWVMNQRYIEGAKACEELVSVDTNTANWFQTIDFNLGQKIKLISNYVDLSAFTPGEGYLENRDKIVILYPRQLYSARGLYLVLEVMDDILEAYSEVEFHFVGRGGEADINLVIERQEKWADRVKFYPLAMEDMPRAYQAADISLIPSVHSEGTSLSCLEAMACGNAVIATRIGGLPDLIINNYNGYLIDPHPQELKQAIINLLNDREQLNLFKKRNPEVAQAFSRDLWRKRWLSLLKNKIEVQETKTGRSRSVEIKLDGNPVDYGKLGELITSLLNNGDLVYVRSHEIPVPELSFARVQWLAPEAPLFAPCDLTIQWQGE